MLSSNSPRSIFSASWSRGFDQAARCASVYSCKACGEVRQNGLANVQRDLTDHGIDIGSTSDCLLDVFRRLREGLQFLADGRSRCESVVLMFEGGFLRAFARVGERGGKVGTILRARRSFYCAQIAL